MGQSIRSRLESRRVGSQPLDGPQKKDDQLDGDSTERRNRLNAPLVLLAAADGSVGQELAVILKYIDELPEDFRRTFGEHVEQDDVECLRLIVSGLQRLRDDEIPSQDELDAIAHSRDAFDETADALVAASESGPISVETFGFVEKHIIEPLRGVSRNFLPDPQFRLVRWWYSELTDDPDGPYRDHTPAEP